MESKEHLNSAPCLPTDDDRQKEEWVERIVEKYSEKVDFLRLINNSQIDQE